MNAAFQDAAFNRRQRLSEGGVFSKWLAEGAAFKRVWRLSEGGIHKRKYGSSPKKKEGKNILAQKVQAKLFLAS